VLVARALPGLLSHQFCEEGPLVFALAGANILSVRNFSSEWYGIAQTVRERVPLHLPDRHCLVACLVLPARPVYTMTTLVSAKTNAREGKKMVLHSSVAKGVKINK